MSGKSVTLNRKSALGDSFTGTFYVYSEFCLYVEFWECVSARVAFSLDGILQNISIL